MSDSVLSEYLKPFQTDPGTRVALLKQVKELNLDAVLEKEVVPNLSKLQVPTLLIWGDRDTYVPLDVGKEIKKNVPGSELYVVLTTQHYPTEERPEDVRQRLKEFIDQP
jgi:pimeloyl-ACP methyl ester carboxylesterase